MGTSAGRQAHKDASEREKKTKAATVTPIARPSKRIAAVPRKKVPEFENTDLGNANRFVAANRGKVLYAKKPKYWYAWDGKRWEADQNSQARRLAMKIALSIREEALNHDADSPEYKAKMGWLRSSQSLKSIDAMVNLAKDQPGMAADITDFDPDPWLVNCESGVLDLRTMELDDHDPEYMCSKLIPCKFSPEARAPLFEKFLEEIMPDALERHFLQRLFGYSLTGSTEEQKLVLFVGDGHNGKSTLVELMRETFGQYATSLPANALLHKINDSIPNDIAKIPGRRMVVASEFPRNSKLNESLIKEITGGDRVNARFLHKEWFNFVPQCQLIVSTNYAPTVAGVDEGIWRRMLQVPFRVHIKKADKTLGAVLRQEVEGVLAWVLEGVEMWKEDGLDEPDSIKQFNAEFRKSSDWLGEFLEEFCDLGDGAQSLRMPKGRLYNLYVKWAKDANLNLMSKQLFSKEMQRRQFESKFTGNVHYWLAIGEKELSGPKIV